MDSISTQQLVVNVNGTLISVYYFSLVAGWGVGGMVEVKGF